MEKIALVERRKAVERDPTCCERIPLEAPQRRRSRSLVGGELQETNPHLSFVVCLTRLISSIFTLLPLDLLGCACLWVQGSLPCLWSSTGATQELRFLLEVKRSLELSFCRFTGWMLTDKRRIPLQSASVRTPHLFHHGIPKVLVNPWSKGITSVRSTMTH
jgi:hypothetical protein